MPVQSKADIEAQLEVSAANMAAVQQRKERERVSEGFTESDPQRPDFSNMIKSTPSQ